MAHFIAQPYASSTPILRRNSISNESHKSQPLLPSLMEGLVGSLGSGIPREETTTLDWKDGRRSRIYVGNFPGSSKASDESVAGPSTVAYVGAPPSRPPRPISKSSVSLKPKSKKARSTFGPQSALARSDNHHYVPDVEAASSNYFIPQRVQRKTIITVYDSSIPTSAMLQTNGSSSKARPTPARLKRRRTSPERLKSTAIWLAASHKPRDIHGVYLRAGVNYIAGAPLDVRRGRKRERNQVVPRRQAISTSPSPPPPKRQKTEATPKRITTYGSRFAIPHNLNASRTPRLARNDNEDDPLNILSPPFTKLAPEKHRTSMPTIPASLSLSAPMSISTAPTPRSILKRSSTTFAQKPASLDLASLYMEQARMASSSNVSVSNPPKRAWGPKSVQEKAGTSSSNAPTSVQPSNPLNTPKVPTPPSASIAERKTKFSYGPKSAQEQKTSASASKQIRDHSAISTSSTSGPLTSRKKMLSISGYASTAAYLFASMRSTPQASVSASPFKAVVSNKPNGKGKEKDISGGGMSIISKERTPGYPTPATATSGGNTIAHMIKSASRENAISKTKSNPPGSKVVQGGGTDRSKVGPRSKLSRKSDGPVVVDVPTSPDQLAPATSRDKRSQVQSVDRDDIIVDGEPDVVSRSADLQSVMDGQSDGTDHFAPDMTAPVEELGFEVMETLAGKVGLVQEIQIVPPGSSTEGTATRDGDDIIAAIGNIVSNYVSPHLAMPCDKLSTHLNSNGSSTSQLEATQATITANNAEPASRTPPPHNLGTTPPPIDVLPVPSNDSVAPSEAIRNGAAGDHVVCPPTPPRSVTPPLVSAPSRFQVSISPSLTLKSNAGVKRDSRTVGGGSHNAIWKGTEWYVDAATLTWKRIATESELGKKKQVERKEEEEETVEEVAVQGYLARDVLSSSPTHQPIPNNSLQLVYPYATSPTPPSSSPHPHPHPHHTNPQVPTNVAFTTKESSSSNRGPHNQPHVYQRAEYLYSDLAKQVNERRASYQKLNFHGSYSQIENPLTIRSFPVSDEFVRGIAHKVRSEGKVSFSTVNISSSSSGSNHTISYMCQCHLDQSMIPTPPCGGSVNIDVEGLSCQYGLRAVNIVVEVVHKDQA